MAAANGTVIHIDKTNDGTPEVTTTLNQGQVYFWDDSNTTPVNNVIGNGLNRGTRVYSDSGKVIQVSLLTGDVCAGYETRSFTLLPTTAWSNQYYAPVSTPGTYQSDVYLYNGGTSSITVNWIFGTGATSSANHHGQLRHECQHPRWDCGPLLQHRHFLCGRHGGYGGRRHQPGRHL